MTLEALTPRPRIVACPACRGDSIYSPENTFRPFCSERCKSVDFGTWATERYRLEASPSTSAGVDLEEGSDSIQRDQSAS